MHQPLKRRIINTKHAPTASGAYSQAVLVGKTVYISGQLGLKPHNLKLVPGGITPETHQALANMGAILRASKCTYKDVIKTTILLQDINDFSVVNDIYSQYFVEHEPARAAFQVGALPRGASIEIDAIAVIGALHSGTILQF